MVEKQDLSNNDLFNKLLGAIKCENEKSTLDIKKHIREENTKLMSLLSEHKEKISELESKCEKLEKRILDIERRSRKNNIIIFGIAIDNQKKIASAVLDRLNQLLEIDISERELNDIFPLKNNNNPPIKIEFSSHVIKDLIFRNAFKLKGTNVTILHDMCYEDRLDHRVLVKHLKAARSKNLAAKIRGNKLVINGDPYTAEQLRNSEQEPVETGVEQNPKKRERVARSAPSTPATPQWSGEVFDHFQDREEDVNDDLNTTIHPQIKKTKTHIVNTANVIQTRNRKGSASSQQKPE